MKKRPLLMIILVLVSALVFSCSSGNHVGGSSKKCGCGVTKGMVGY